MTVIEPAVHCNTPAVTVFDRGLTVREIAFYRHPSDVERTDSRITRHHYDARGALRRSADPRLGEAGQANFIHITDLLGNAVHTQSVDAGTTVSLNDAASRLCLKISHIQTHEDGQEDCSQAVTQTFQYEDAALPGRPLYVTEQTAGGACCITERFVYGGRSVEEQRRNLAGMCIRHYDTAGVVQRGSIALTGAALSTTRRLLNNGDDPDTVIDWRGDDAVAWDSNLEPMNQAHTTLATTDATGTAVGIIDAAGNAQRLAYDVAGRLVGSWLTRKGAAEQVIVKSLTYSAAGQKLREEHGNGVVTTYTYEAMTQRLAGIKTTRPARYSSGASALQDLRYTYDPVGNVLSVRNDAEATRFWRNQKMVPENIYTYDSHYQLASATGREMANAGQGRNLPHLTPFDSATYTQYTRTYRYDRAGNLIQIRHSAPATNNSYTTEITVSDRSNRAVLSSLATDPRQVEALFGAAGQQNVLSPGQQLAWTPRAEVRYVAPVTREGGLDDRESYRYDSASQRVLKSSLQRTAGGMLTQRVTYLPGLELRRTSVGEKVTESLQVMTVGESGRAQVRMLHWETGKPLDIANDQLRYSYDSLIGSSALELDGSGNVISQEEYYPFGGTAVWVARNEIVGRYKTIRYSGKERDATGLYYYGYRYYQPWVGRWLSADPAGTVDGLNLYAMVGSNPVTFRDSDGRVKDETFESFFGKDFSALDAYIKFPDIFKGQAAPMKFTGNVHVDEAKRKLTVSWERRVDAYQPSASELNIHDAPAADATLPQNPSDTDYAKWLGTTEQFAKDLKRTENLYVLRAGDAEAPLLPFNIKSFIKPQSLGVISTLAHQAHLAPITMEVMNIPFVGEAFALWVGAIGATPETYIDIEEEGASVTSRFAFTLKDVETERKKSELHLIAEQTTWLGVSQGDEGPYYSLQTDKQSVQRIRINLALPDINIAPTKTSFFPSLFKRKQ